MQTAGRRKRRDVLIVEDDPRCGQTDGRSAQTMRHPNAPERGDKQSGRYGDPVPSAGARTRPRT